MKHIHLGNKVKDTVTGFEGIATARFEYLNGCIRYMVEAGKKDGGVEELAFDEQRLEDLSDRVEVPSAPTGGSRPLPPNRPVPR